MGNSNKQKTSHKNQEKTVICPVEGCDKEALARGLHLHVRQSSGGGHGDSRSVPDHLNLDDAEVVGDREVEMEYPDERDIEEVARLCPYCERPYRGKQGVMIHLGQTAGRKDHPEDAAERHDMSDFPIVKVDDDGNIVERIDGDTKMPSTERRQENGQPDKEDVREYIAGLREQGLDEQAEQAEQMLL